MSNITTFLDLCSGIGGGRLGLELAGLKCVGYSDTSKLAVRTYNLMHDTDGEQYFYNLKRIKTENLPTYDMLIAGFPCQTFSVIGRKEGFSDDRGQIIFHLVRILEESKPKCFLFENVKGLVTHDKGNTLKIIINELNNAGYDVVYKVLTSLDYGVPQMRQRVYFVGIRKDLNVDINKFQWPKPVEKPPLSDYLIDDNVASEYRLEILSYYLNNPTNNGKYTVADIKEMEGKIIDTRMNDLRIYDGKCPTLRAQRDGVLYVKNRTIYQLTGYEALLLQGFPRNYADKVKDEVTDRHLLMQAGNAMTVNVIKLLGQSIIKLLNDNDNPLTIYKNTKNEREVLIMRPGEQFELDSLEYLRTSYGKDGIEFFHHDTADSTGSDIEVIINGHSAFFIEAKDTAAQSGQFVLLPDDASKTFIFSPRNKSLPNEMTELMIAYMNQDYDRFNAAGTAGEVLNIDPDIFTQWIIGHYREKKVKYVISKRNHMLICPIEKFGEYFEVSANFRIKKSGSSEPSGIYVDAVISALKNKFGITDVYKQTVKGKKKLFANAPASLSKVRFELGNYTYYLSPQTDEGLFEVKQLSNTRNKNVIFTINVKQEQLASDLEKFRSELL